MKCYSLQGGHSLSPARKREAQPQRRPAAGALRQGGVRQELKLSQFG